MSTRASATRYARALFDVALTESSVEQAEKDLTTFVDLVRGHQDLQMALTSPAVSAANKHAVVRELLSRLSLSTPSVVKLLALVAERDRLALLPELLTAYRERLRQHLRILEAEVTTAMPLADDRAAALRDRLAAITGRQVTMTTKVDPALIGGMIARLGSTVYDGSVAAQLERMRQRLDAQR